MKSKGGKGKKADYKTSTVRVPIDILSEVKNLINDFHSSQPDECPDGKISIEDCHILMQCATQDGMHFDDGKAAIYRPIEEQATKLIRAFDSSWESIDPFNTISRLIEFKLLFVSSDYKPVGCLELVNWLKLLNFKPEPCNFIIHAIEAGRFDIARGLHENSAITPEEYWREFIAKNKSSLKSKWLEYSRNKVLSGMDADLDIFFSMPTPPQFFVCKVLEHLGDEVFPFEPEEKESRRDIGYLYTVVTKRGGIFNDIMYQNVWNQRYEIIGQFLKWHSKIKVPASDRHRCFFNLFGFDEEDILKKLKSYNKQEKSKERTHTTPRNNKARFRGWAEVLGVSPQANLQEVRVRYLELCKEFHPDICSDPHADEKMKQINKAYEQAKKDLAVPS
ncbi:MAG: J domain-containing protein [Rhizonema sp. PD38]|nr:J domain-containing protein [Rhizonema sp. PD38]